MGPIAQLVEQRTVIHGFMARFGFISHFVQHREFWYFLIMKTFLKFVIILSLIQFSTAQPTQAAFRLTISYVVPFNDDSGWLSDPSPTCLVDDSKCSKDNQKKAALLLKKPSTKNAFNLGCKEQDDSYLGSRLKVTNASGATAGLGNLTSVASTNIRLERNTASVPDWSGEDRYPYESEEDDPAYIEDGYVYFEFAADCIYTGGVTLVKSNAYTIFIDGSRGPEYSHGELVKKKWKVTLVDS